MDFAETALNLRDIQPALEIVILMDQTPDAQMTAQIAAVLRAIPNSRILTTNELDAYLMSSQTG